MEHIIRVLTTDITNRIAAGEVVERPASIVKELVENAIDAGATIIHIEVERGGIDLIRITDNGCGIPADQVETAFMPHATSKILRSEDLFDIHTLGFRGEALPSIAAIAKVTLHTRVKNAEIGTLIRIEGGQLVDKAPDGCAEGTIIEVTSLFYNTPVRLNFLKGPAAEFGAIGEVIARLILSNPGITIRLMSNGTMVYHSPGSGRLLDAVYCALGRQAAQSMLNLHGEDGTWHLEGLLGQPLSARGNRGWQHIVINGRSIRSIPLSRTVENAYGNRLMVGRFPAFLLNLELPTDEIDVNVHPNKLEIRMRRERELLGWISGCVKDTLSEIDRMLPPAFTQPGDTQSNIPIQPSRYLSTSNGIRSTLNEIPQFVFATPQSVTAREPDSAVLLEQRKSYDVELPIEVEMRARNRPTDEAEMPTTPLDSQVSLPFEQQPFIILGQLFNTYILIQAEDALLFIDQHAAQERLIYDQYMDQMQRSEVVIQTLLMPVSVPVTTQEAAAFIEGRVTFERMGFVIEQVENTLLVHALPLSFQHAAVQPLINELILQLANPGTLDARRAAMAKAACKRAIKAGDNLSRNEIAALMEQIRLHQGSLNCPHGRPIVVAMTRTDLEKRFKRLV